jgi:ankyrin repeat protein
MNSNQFGRGYSYQQGLDVALLDAVRDSDAAKTKELLSLGANANCCNNYNEPVLIEAINGGNIDIVRALFDDGAGIFVFDKDGQSSLSKVIKLGFVDIAIDMICILENLVNDFEHHESEAASNLLKEGMIEAIKSNQIWIARDLSASSDIYNLDQYGNSALMHACINDRLEIAKILMITNYDPSNGEENADNDYYDFELLLHQNIYGYNVMDFNLSPSIKEFLNLAHGRYEQSGEGQEEASSDSSDIMDIDSDNSGDPYVHSDYQLSGGLSDIDDGTDPS